MGAACFNCFSRLRLSAADNLPSLLLRVNDVDDGDPEGEALRSPDRRLAFLALRGDIRVERFPSGLWDLIFKPLLPGLLCLGGEL